MIVLSPAMFKLVFSFDLLWLFVFNGRVKGVQFHHTLSKQKHSDG